MDEEIFYLFLMETQREVDA